MPLAGHARASLDFSGLATLELVQNHQVKGELLEKAARKAAAWAVAEETAAAKAVGGSPSARILASARARGQLWHAGQTKVSALGRFEVINESHINESHANNSAHEVNASAPVSKKEGINPFNPFSNPFFNPFTPNPYTPMHSGGGGLKGGNLLIVLFLVVLAVSFCAITCGGIEDEDDSSGDDSSLGYLNRLDMDGARRGRDKMARKLTADERKRTCSLFSCCGFRCPTTVVIFTIVAAFVTVLGGKILWNCGILQPLLAQLLLYAYVILIIVGFVAVITHELTRKVRTMLRGISQNLSSVTEVMPGFMRNKKGNTSPRF
eukprot:Skav218422  [mRNA]  locus=scaffold420:13994:14956:- [translate_table: standard]